MIPAVESARVRRFRMERVRVPGKATVRVEIGPVVWSTATRDYPRYRVLVDGVVVGWDSGVRDPDDWSVPRGAVRDGVDAALALVWHEADGDHSACQTWLTDWVAARQATRAELLAERLTIHA